MYVPAYKNEMFSKVELKPFGPFQEYEYVPEPVPPLTYVLIDPSFAPFNETSITDEEIVNNEGFEI